MIIVSHLLKQPVVHLSDVAHRPLVKFRYDSFIGEQARLTGSAEFAVLGNPFTWTCEMLIHNGTNVNAVKFYRVDRVCAIIGYINNKCYLQSYNDRYTYECLPESTHQYTLTLPAENMTEFEQSVIWYCESVDGSNASPKVSLRIASKLFGSE